MIINVIAMSDVGCTRTINEDMILAGDELLRDGAKQYEFNLADSECPTLIAVADGLGGHKGGAVASETVLVEMSKATRSLKQNMPVAELKIELRKIIFSIHSQLNEGGLTDTAKAGMGSTFIGLLFYEQSIFFINIGDSRLYRFRDGILSQFSRDHSLAAMTNNPDAPRHVLVNSFGAGAEIFFDFEDISNRIIDNDVLLLCSDGLTTELTDPDIESLLSDSIDPVLLVNAAKNNEGKDNISVVVVKCKRE